MIKSALLLRSLFALCMLLFAAPSFSQTLKPYEAQYKAYRWGSSLGTASMALEQLSESQYSLLYQSKVSKFFLSDKRTEHSIFSVDGDALIPNEYHYSRTGTGKDKALHVQFKPDTKQIHIEKDKKTERIPWQGQVDNQLYRLMVPSLLEAGNSEFDVSFINYRGENKQYQIQVIESETLDLPYGKVDAIKTRIVRQNSSRETFAWFAPTLDHVLVRLQQYKDGDEQGDIRLSSYTTVTADR